MYVLMTFVIVHLKVAVANSGFSRLQVVQQHRTEILVCS